MFQPALHHWTIALKIRRQHGKNGVPLPKRPVMTPKAAFDFATEFTTIEELLNMTHGKLRAQDILYTEVAEGQSVKCVITFDEWEYQGLV